jgi:excinuclease ABC subunit B
VYEADYVTVPVIAEETKKYMGPDVIRDMISDLNKRMKEAAAKLEFEEAAKLRDEIRTLQQEELEVRG